MVAVLPLYFVEIHKPGKVGGKLFNTQGVAPGRQRERDVLLSSYPWIFRDIILYSLQPSQTTHTYTRAHTYAQS
jgi:hypothetical protein